MSGYCIQWNSCVQGMVETGNGNTRCTTNTSIISNTMCTRYGKNRVYMVIQVIQVIHGNKERRFALQEGLDGWAVL